ncbi:MAG: hypothetical protein AB1758_07940 [Candidatus Eremiobacterota bacterium]
MRWMALLALVMTLAGPLKADGPVRVAPDLTVTRVHFGVFRQEPDGSLTFVPTREVPLRTGQYFGWRMDLDTTRDKVRWKEELELPSAPEKWAPDTLIQGDRRIGVTEREEDIFNGWVVHIWRVAQGDPPGTYTLRLFVDGKPVETVEFTVKKP